MKTSKDIRNEFISFFESKGHHYVRSSPVVPVGDPTLLFSNAGMNQFRDVFLGTGTRDYTRAANSQKCLRASGKHNDLEDVGRDNFHHTFFEMLGNWSFGDYFKEDSIRWAWELCVERWNLPADNLWATVFEGNSGENLNPDIEAEELWKKVTGINPDHIIRFGKKDNFWEMGDVGPCGPCSELHIDLGTGTCPKSDQHECGVNVDGCWRFVELWNLVFIQYNRLLSGKLESLPAKHVDTGMGLERICRVMQGVDSNYSTDLFTPIIKEIEHITGKKDQDGEIGVAFRVIADHIRALSFAIADGAIPSNEGRGYVLRRMLRRATRFGRILGMHCPFIHQLVPIVADIMGDSYPEIVAQANHVAGVIEAEEASFGQTLDRGLEIFEKMVDLPETQKTGILGGENVFKLYDTYGFPVDLTQLMCEERNLSIDEDQFNQLMEEQRTRAKNATKFKITLGDWKTVSEGSHSKFLGYDCFQTESVVRRYTLNDKEQILIVLDKTPFYAESGGQLGDQGEISQGEKIWQVVDVQKEGDAIIHFCNGKFDPDNKPVNACVKSGKRIKTASNHTATHLLQAALRKVVGDHIHQAGSVVHPEYLRFDFTHFERLNDDQLKKIEKVVNEKIRENLPLSIYETSYNEAIDQGVTALFGEKYEDQVRVVRVPEFSAELCGGCHVRSTGDIGSFRILSEAGIAAGIRRIVATTGEEVEKLWRKENNILAQLKQMFNSSIEDLPEIITNLSNEKKQLEKELQALKKESKSGEVNQLINQAKEIEGIKVVISQVKANNMEEFKHCGDSIRKQMKPGIGILATEINNKVSFLCVLSDDLVQKKLKAPDIVNGVAAFADGRGGGRPHMAQAGAKSPEKLNEAIEKAPTVIEQYLQQKLR